MSSDPEPLRTFVFVCACCCQCTGSMFNRRMLRLCECLQILSQRRGSLLTLVVGLQSRVLLLPIQVCKGTLASDTVSLQKSGPVHPE